MTLNVSGLVTKVRNIGEYDRIITVITDELGVINAFCRGVRRVKSKRLSATSLLTYSEFSVTQARDGYTISEASPIEVFIGLRDNLVSLSLAQYLCELFCEFCVEGMRSDETLRLLLNSLHFISSGKREPLLIKVIAELRLLSESGYMPNLVGCAECGEYENEEMSFDIESGFIYCGACCPAGNFRRLPPAQLNAFRYISYSDFEKLFSFTLSGDSLIQLAQTAEEYLLNKTGRSYPTLDFFKTVIS